MFKSELLAPVSDYSSFYQGLKAGADAFYFGGKAFGARAYAENLNTIEIKEMIDIAHIYNKKTYATVNTIVFEKEIEEVIEFLDFSYLAGVDGIIVQDLGIVNIILKKYPGLELHASTQMNIRTIKEARVLKELGFKRIVLPRELTIEEIINIKNNVDIELEVFIHGALCVSFSGNCLFSSFHGGRSGNRGKCAQPCRHLYKIDDGNESYAISPRELNTTEHIKKLLELGINSLKIEGRMKSEDYIYKTTSIYRSIIDDLLIGKIPDYKEMNKDLEILFNRKFTKGFLFNEKNEDFINTETSNHIGLFIGNVLNVDKNYISFKTSEDLYFNDGLRILGDDLDAVVINQLEVDNKMVHSASKGSVVKIRAHYDHKIGSKIYLTSTKRFLNETKNSLLPKIGIKGKLYLENDCLNLLLDDGENVIIESSNKVAEGRNINFLDRIKEQVLKINDSHYFYEELILDIKQMIFLPIKEINLLRRNAINKIDEVRKNKYKEREIKDFIFKKREFIRHEPLLIVKCLTKEQINAAISLDIKNIITEKVVLYNYYQEKYPEINFYYYNSRVEEEKDFNNLVTNSFGNIGEQISSWYLNVCNTYAVDLLNDFNVREIGLSTELSFDDIKDMTSLYNIENKNLPNLLMYAYGRVELMVMKYCPINKDSNLLNNGCSLCLDKQHYLVKDENNYPLIKDKFCHMRILNHQVIDLSNHLIELKEIGVNSFLLDFSIEDEEEVKNVIEKFNLSLKDKLTGKDNYLGHLYNKVL